MSRFPTTEANGYVLGRIDYQERDLILRAAVEDEGILSFHARGARGSTRRFAGGVDDFVPSRFEFVKKKKGLCRLAGAQRRSIAEPAPADLAAFAVRSYVAELLLVVVEEGHPTRFPFRIMEWVTEALAASVPTEQRRSRAGWVVDRVHVILLHREGRLPILGSCSDCGIELESAEEIFFTTEQGLRCDGCGPGRGAWPDCGVDDLAMLWGLYAGQPFTGPRASKPLQHWLFGLVDQVADKSLKSRASLQQFVG